MFTEASAEEPKTVMGRCLLSGRGFFELRFPLGVTWFEACLPKNPAPFNPTAFAAFEDASSYVVYTSDQAHFSAELRGRVYSCRGLGRSLQGGSGIGARGPGSG